MDRLTFEGNFCDISRCQNTPGGSFCEGGACSQRKVWERLKEYEDTGLTPEEVKWDERVLHIMAKEYYQKVMKTIKNGPSGGVKPKGIIAEAREKAKEGRK